MRAAVAPAKIHAKKTEGTSQRPEIESPRDQFSIPPEFTGLILRSFGGTKASSRDAMQALARRTNRFPRSIGGQTVHLDAQTVRSDGEKIGMSRRKTDTDRKMIGLGRRGDTGSRMRSGSGPKSIHMNWKSFRSGDKSVRSDETAVGMTRTTIHITRKINYAVTDVDHGMIHTDRCRDPYGE